MRLHFKFFSFFLLIIPFLGFGDNIFDSNKWYVEAKYYYFERYDYERAYRCLKRALMLNPDNKDALKLKKKMGDLYDFFELALKPAPKQTKKTDVISELKPKKLIKPEHSKKISIPGIDDFSYKLALKKAWNGEFKLAIDYLMKNIKDYPENIKAYYYLVLIGEHLTDKKLIINSIKKAVHLLPLYKDLDIYNDFVNLIVCLRNKRVLKSALLSYNRDITLKKNTQDYFRYSYLDMDKERLEFEVLNELDQNVLIKKHYLNAKIFCPSKGEYKLKDNKIYCSYHDSILKSAYYELVKPVEEDIPLSDKYKAYYHLKKAREFILQKRYYRALAEAKKGYSLNPLDYRLADILGQVYYYLEKYEKALEFGKKALSLSIDSPVVYNNLGLTYLALKRIDDAITYLKLGLAIKKGDFDLNYNIASAYLEKKDYKKAKDHLEVCKIVNPNYPGVYFRLGKIYQFLGKKELALKNYKKLLNLVPHEGKVYNMILSIINAL